MALFEVELDNLFFRELVDYVVGSAPTVPAPTLESLQLPEVDRLVTAFAWGSAQFAGASAPVSVSLGSVLMEAPLTITHVGLDAVKADFNSPRQSDVYTGYIGVRLSVGQTTQLIVELLVLKNGTGTSVTLPMPVVLMRFALPPTPIAVVGAAVLRGATSVTIRLATDAADPLFGPPRDTLRVDGGQWEFWIPAAFFVAQLLDRLNTAIANMKHPMPVSEKPSASWGYIADKQAWGVTATCTLEKVDACPAFPDDVDVSVDVTVVMTVSVVDDALAFELEINADASDWDTFRCWLEGAVISDVLGQFWALAGVASAIGSLVFLGEMVRGGVVDGLKDLTLDDMVEVSRSGESVTYRGSIALPGLPHTGAPIANFSTAGLGISAKAPPLAAPKHVVTVTPGDGVLWADWDVRIDCSDGGYAVDLALPPITVTDHTELGSDRQDLRVTVWGTSDAMPEESWYIPFPAAAVTQVVQVTRHMSHAGSKGSVLLHTSAGLFGFTINLPIDPPDLSAVPSPSVIAKICRSRMVMSFVDMLDQIWMQPKPNWSLGYRAMRQWSVAIVGLEPGEQVALIAADRAVRSRRPTTMLTASVDGSIQFEFVADQASRLRLMRSGKGIAQARLAQRWLLPYRRLELPQAALRLTRLGGAIGVVTEQSVLAADVERNVLQRLSAQHAASLRQAGYRLSPRLRLPEHAAAIERGQLVPTQSLTLSGNRVAIAHGRALVFARAFAQTAPSCGCASPPTRPEAAAGLRPRSAR